MTISLSGEAALLQNSRCFTNRNKWIILPNSKRQLSISRTTILATCPWPLWRHSPSTPKLRICTSNSRNNSFKTTFKNQRPPRQLSGQVREISSHSMKMIGPVRLCGHPRPWKRRSNSLRRRMKEEASAGWAKLQPSKNSRTGIKSKNPSGLTKPSIRQVMRMVRKLSLLAAVFPSINREAKITIWIQKIERMMHPRSHCNQAEIRNNQRSKMKRLII